MLRGAADRALKRGIDVLVSGIGLLLCAPVLAVAALLIYLEDGGPVLYRQSRPGRGGRPFEMLKLRSMRATPPPMLEVSQADATPLLISDDPGPDPRLITRTGRVLRRFKIDELIQLVNVLRGDMSLVGPRPSLPELAEQCNDFQRRRLQVPPGMTGWAQVNGGVHLRWDKRILLDIWYLDHWSLGLDLQILLKTAGVVLFGELRNAPSRAAAMTHAAQAAAQQGVAPVAPAESADASRGMEPKTDRRTATPASPAVNQASERGHPEVSKARPNAVEFVVKRSPDG